MKTFESIYCEKHGCDAARFRNRVFWRTLHRRVLPVAPLLMLTDYFDPDRELVAASGRARSVTEVQEEIESYRFHPNNRGWLRRALKMRVSAGRLQRLARNYLPERV